MSKIAEYLRETAELLGIDPNNEEEFDARYDEIFLAARIRLDAKLAERKPGVCGLVGFGPPPGQQAGSLVVGRDMEAVYDPTQPAFGMGDEEDDEEAKIFTLENGDDEDVHVTHWRIVDDEKEGRMLQVWSEEDWVNWASGPFITDCLKKFEKLGIPEYDDRDEDEDEELDSQVIYDDMEKTMKKIEAALRCPKCGSEEIGTMMVNNKQMICCENPECDYVGDYAGQVKVVEDTLAGVEPSKDTLHPEGI